MGLSGTPTNQNLAQASKFLLSFARLPSMTFFCTQANIPSVSVPPMTQPTPGVDAPLPGQKLVYDPLDITFILDEELLGWTSILDWMKGYSTPENDQQYKTLSLQQRLLLSQNGNKPQYSDALLTYYTNKNNPVLQVKFTDIFPITLSGIQFDVAHSAENVLVATAQFKFTNYDINRL